MESEKEALLNGRYSRQVLFPPIGRAGQERIMSARAALVGCGALGTAIACALVRAGIGFLRIADRDFVEESNLQRQLLYTTRDVRDNLPKVEAARRHLSEINPHVALEAHVMDVDATNIVGLVGDVDLILDGTDNFDTRYLLNDAAVSLEKPWVYGGVLGSAGMAAALVPGHGCLRCLLPDAPPPGETGTCDTAGVLNTTVMMIGSIQATEAMKILTTERQEDEPGTMISVDIWSRHFQKLQFQRDPDCEACARHNFEYLNAQRGSFATSMCGRNAYQLSWKEKRVLDMDEIAARLAGAGTVVRNPFLLKFESPDGKMTLFPDGRAIIEGAQDAAAARAFYSRFVG